MEFQNHKVSSKNVLRGLDFAPIKFDVADDLSYWHAEILGKVVAKAEALTGPMTPPGKRVQTLNLPGTEVGPGTIATWVAER